MTGSNTAQVAGALLLATACAVAVRAGDPPGGGTTSSEMAPMTPIEAPADDSTAVEPESAELPAEKAASQAESAWAPARTRATSAGRAADPPGYARPLERYFEGGQDLSWLLIGVEQRTRFEIRDDYYREGLLSDEQFLLRTRAFIGVRDVIDPLRFGVEFQDSRVFGSEFPERAGDVDEADLIQAYGELYFASALGGDQPVSFRVGRMSFDAVDRRLFGRNRFRNTTNAFDGFRLRFGHERSKWELDTFALQPVVRRPHQFDHADEERWVYGVNAYWRGWSPHVTLEPYYFIVDEDYRDRFDRELHAIGLHAFGLIGASGFDYDLDAVFQFGDREGGDIHAFGAHAELGYTFRHDWRPRVAAMFDFATGDGDPTNSRFETFDPLFGVSHMFYGNSGLLFWRNAIQPALYVSAHPTEKLHIETVYRAHWRAAKADAFLDFMDPDGRGGRFVGQEIDLRVRYDLCENAELDIGYAHFFQGSFLQNVVEESDDSDFFYVQVTFTF